MNLTENKTEDLGSLSEASFKKGPTSENQELASKQVRVIAIFDYFRSTTTMKSKLWKKNLSN
jgi:hypothetical protein